jgi:tetratricopeptide (TPR) repeat protein/SAM-dependent methyltransferase
MNRKERRAAQRLGSSSGTAAAEQAQRLFAQAVQHHRLGQFADAERCYRSLLASRQTHEHSLYNLGVLALQTNRPELAAEMLGKAVAIDGGNAEWCYNYGFSLQQTGRDDEAVEQYSRAIALMPDHPEAQLNLGNLLLRLGRLPEAVAAYERLAKLKPDLAETHYNLGNALAQQGRTAEAIACFERSLAIKPLPEIHNNLGIALARDPARADEALAHYRAALAVDPNFVEADLNIGALQASRGRLEDAAAAFSRVIAARPDHVEAHENLARTMIAGGDPTVALPVLARALQLHETPSVKHLLFLCLREVRAAADDPALRALVLRALSEPWGRPAELSNVAASLIKARPAVAQSSARCAQAWPRRLGEGELFGPHGLTVVADDELLRTLLTVSRVTDLALERLLTMTRTLLLRRAMEAVPAMPDAHLRFWSALAQQCHINEYVFATTEAEDADVLQLHEVVAAALAAGEPVSDLAVLALAAYAALDELVGATRLLDRSWPAPVEAVLTQQLRELAEERELRAALPQLTPIEDRVSREVQAQYEENPYPRWVTAPPSPPRRDLGERLRLRFPRADIRPLGNGGRIDILVAGCGTGQHAIEVAQENPEARVLAIDLSRASLGYAARKTRERGLANIEYAQGDILALGDIGRSFDLIESSGVLHHLAEPFAGWQVLVSLLRPRGLMNIGLYSERGRRPLGAVRRRIVARGYQPTAADIRRCRQELMDDPADTAKVVEIGDFYTVSDCRDLLFHVQEQQLTLPAIQAFLALNELRFLGFDLGAARLQAYAARFPDDTAMTDLDHWHAFEQQNPDTFIDMYQFWVQKAD